MNLYEAFRNELYNRMILMHDLKTNSACKNNKKKKKQCINPYQSSREIFTANFFKMTIGFFHLFINNANDRSVKISMKKKAKIKVPGI